MICLIVGLLFYLLSYVGGLSLARDLARYHGDTEMFKVIIGASLFVGTIIISIGLGCIYKEDSISTKTSQIQSEETAIVTTITTEN